MGEERKNFIHINHKSEGNMGREELTPSESEWQVMETSFVLIKV